MTLTPLEPKLSLKSVVNLVRAIGCVHIAESVGSRRELVANSCTHRRRDETRQFRLIGVGGVYWALGYIHCVPQKNTRFIFSSFLTQVLTGFNNSFTAVFSDELQKNL